MSKRNQARADVKTRKRPNTTHANADAGRARVRLRWMGGAGAALVVLVVVVIILVASGGSGPPATKTTRIAAVAPDGSFSTTSGATQTVSALRGQATLLWFVSTWCSSCQAGTQAMASRIGYFAAHHVRVVELELADDLGQSGPSITEFAKQLAGPGYRNPNWTFGVASAPLTTAYDAPGYLDIYYLLDASGRLAYTNGSPGTTMSQLLGAVSKLSPRT